jgi:glycosyltransferase involved in cell wall biosynthesis
MEKISVVIITFNEEANIGRTIDAAWKVADEIIIADSGSTDNTREVSITKGATFIHQPWLGFGAQRNFAVSKSAFSFILVLDADEVLDEDLIHSIHLVKEQGLPEKVYALQRRNSYYGRFIRHGIDKLEIKPRLYHKHFAKWDNKLVHENLEIATGVKAAMLKGYLLHYTYKSISDHMLKMNMYTSLSAQEYYNNGRQEPGFIKLVLSPAFTFFNAYIIKGGFLDGWHGLLLARFRANGVFQKYAKLKMIYDEKRRTT